MNRDEIVQETRSWIGTKWQHQACLKGIACDCVGLVRGVYGALIGPLHTTIDYAQEWPLYKTEEKMYKEFQKYFTERPVDKANIGDILLFGFGKGPAHHCAVISYDGLIIHTWMEVGKVTESRFDFEWRRNCRYAFAFPSIDD